MFIETPTALPFGTKIVVMIRLPGLHQEAKVESIVRWTQPTGMGVQFGPMGARETHALTELLK
jgi:type IV pilus assembly protein PilZ